MDALYQEQILALAKAVRLQVPLPQPDKTATHSNPLCGDRVDISLTLDHTIITDIGASVRGCALCEAGTGLLMAIAPRISTTDLAVLTDAFALWLAGDDAAPIHKEMQKFMPVRGIRNRHKCVLLSFEAARAAIA